MTRAQAKRLAEIAAAEASRAKRKIKVDGYPSPFFVSFRILDDEAWLVKAQYGALVAQESRRRRHCFADVRVGSYQRDQLQEGGLTENPEELESYNYVRIPYQADSLGIEHALWRLVDSKYREAIESLGSKHSHELTYLDRNRNFPSFERRKAQQSMLWRPPQAPDLEAWSRYVVQASRSLRHFPQIKMSHVKFETYHQVRVFSSTEGTQVVENQQFWILNCYLWLLSPRGNAHEWTLQYFVREPGELPTLAKFKREIAGTVELLGALSESPTLQAYAGPVLLDPQPAGLLIHEALGHRLEGSRLLASGEGQTFRDSRGELVLPPFISIYDDPRQRHFKGESLVGHYEYDDEGVPARRSSLVSSGVLDGFLTSRAGISKRHRSNGHARCESHQRPMSRMGVTVVESASGESDQQLKQRLLEEVDRQKLPFGIRIRLANGGETATEAYDFQAFLGDITLASKIYPDGREELVRGVDFVGTPLNAARSIIGIGDQPVLDNAFCGAESGWVPVSTISPALLLSRLELQAKSEEPFTQYVYPLPWE